VRPLSPFTQFVRSADAGSVRLIPHEKVSTPLLRQAVPEGLDKVVIAVGPEGGFTEEEIAQAVRAGFLTVSLGPRRLRAETAALVAAAGVLL